MKPLQRWLGLGLCALAIVSGGCNVLSLPFFLTGGEPSVEPTLKQLATEDKKERVKVAVIVTSTLEVRDQLARVDRELAALVVKHLKLLCQHNEENVVVLPVNTIERYKTEHPDWERPFDAVQVGKDLKVQYVLYLEINALSLYKPLSNNQFYQGQSDIKVSLVNVRKPDDPPDEEPSFHEVFPTSEVSAFDEPNPVAFRRKFLDHVAERIAWKFTKHPTKRDYGAE